MAGVVKEGGGRFQLRHCRW